MSSHQEDPEIQNRESWLKVGVAAVLVGVLAWKLAVFDFSALKLDVGTLLSVLLALFAIALSVAFYFKATDTSNLFYDNTYKFTKDISEILGRIEAGFGERLRHLDEGYSGLRDTVARLPFDPAAASKAIEQEEKGVVKLEAEKQRLLDEIADKAKLQDVERKQLFDSLAGKDAELRNARAEIASLRRQVLGSSVHPESAAPNRALLLERVRGYLSAPKQRALFTGSLATVDAMRERFAEVKEVLHPAFIRDLGLLGMLGADGRLNSIGVRWLRRFVQSGPEDAG